MAKLISLIVSFLLNQYVQAATYDQRQTGDVNVQVELNDLQIIALLKGGKQEYVDYDYVYDYSEMTIKPPNGQPAKPLNATGTVTESMKDNITMPTTVFIEQTTESAIKNSSVLLHLETTDVTLNSTLSDTTTFKPLEDLPSTATTGEIKNVTTTTPSNTCKKGFILNAKGNCELKLQATSNKYKLEEERKEKLKSRKEKCDKI
ncbi:hypothetical protein K1T71_003985 [Dendrolimus kikuchii]|uniref:Uncharacterized protein n=1 Tax=Dendrolimus kikuchii TaxID=765133 RepID=A0ACC1D9L0_9NEOP|nr:hypothetical protein K1T71_003985 [Dendrolimus kikuchii]